MSKLVFSMSVFFSILTLTQAQCIKGNCQTGEGTYRFASGARYVGSFVNGRMHGEGTCHFTNGDIYIGEWYKNIRQGRGIFKKASGDRYEGDFRHNQMHGDGTVIFADGAIFTGQWELGKAIGKGEYIDTDGISHVGVMEAGKVKKVDEQQDSGSIQPLRNCNQEYCKTGIGSYTFADGSIYEGEFKDGAPFGLGTCYYSNGDKYVGDWKHQAPDGVGTLHYKDKAAIKGTWANGKMKYRNKQDIQYQAKSNSDRVDIYAVIVGVARYTKFEALKYTDDDAYRMYAFLKSPEGGAVPDDHISILIDESAVRGNIEKSLDQVVAQADENDVVITYFAGHGLVGSFIPYDCNGYENQLKYDDIRKKLALSRAKQKLCIVDACHSGSLLAMKAPMMESLNLFYNQLSSSDGGTAFLVSSKEEEYSLESRGLRQGIFSHFLIRGLSGQADRNQNKIVTISELFDFVHREVTNYSGEAQNPVLAGSFDHQMPVGLVR